MKAELILMILQAAGKFADFARAKIAAGHPPTFEDGRPMTMADVEAAGFRLAADAAAGAREAEASLASRRPTGEPIP